MDEPADVPTLVPARMLNEFVYCPRLFYLEWVDSLFEDNSDTAAGSLIHRRSDRPAGRLPEAGELGAEWSGEARSITLDAPALGLIARMDLVQGDDGAVVPVDHKKGSPRDDGTAWEPERLQLAAQVLILRENGYRCERGFLSFRETRTRVEVVVDGALEAEVRRRLGQLRRVAASTEPPPPLVDSPKCPRCSLVSICLPDETNALLERSARADPRRLIAAKGDSAPLYVQERGSLVRLVKGRVEVWRERERITSVRQIDVSEVAIFGAGAITEPALRELAGQGIPITHFSFGGWFQALTVGVETGNIGLRIAQHRHADDAAASLALARRFIEAKIKNCRVLLRRNGDETVTPALLELRRLARLAARAPVVETLLGLEGAAAREYYRAIPALLRPRARRAGLTLDFARRSRRPPRDPANAVLSFLYALLTKECTLATRRVGLEPLLGFFHRPRFGRPALALDLMEEFRPVIADSTFLTLANGGRLTPGDFVERGGAVGLTSSGRKAVIAAYEQRLSTEVIHPTFHYRVTYRRALELQARILAAAVLGELPQYTAFTIR